jgi:thymidylate synthase
LLYKFSEREKLYIFYQRFIYKSSNFNEEMKEDDYGIPVLNVEGNSLAETWERAMLRLYESGARIATQYDKPGDPKSIDATMIINVKHPDAEPRIHKSFPGGVEDLVEYDLEVNQGVKDSWVRNPENPLDTRWEYTYHGRIFDRQMPVTNLMSYISELPEEIKKEMKKRGVRILLDMPWAKRDVKEIGGKSEAVVSINQIDACIEMLSETPFTRRAQVITWQPEEDLVSYDPPCLQSMWFRILQGSDGKNRLNMNVRIRSNDAYGASFMNMYAFSNMQKNVAQRVSENRGEEILLGRYAHMADSFHIYGKDIKSFEERFLGAIEKRPFEERTWRSDDETVLYAMNEALPGILEKIRLQSEKYRK